MLARLSACGVACIYLRVSFVPAALRGAALPTLPAAAMSALADILHSELPRLLDEKKEARASSEFPTPEFA